MAVLYQVEEQGRQTAFVGEKEGGFTELHSLLERASAIVEVENSGFAEALSNAAAERGTPLRQVFADEAEALSHDLGHGGIVEQQVVIDLDNGRIRVEYDHRAGSLRESLDALSKHFPTAGANRIQNRLIAFLAEHDGSEELYKVLHDELGLTNQEIEAMGFDLTHRYEPDCGDAYQDIVDYIRFEQETSEIWPWFISCDEILSHETTLREIAGRMSAVGEWDEKALGIGKRGEARVEYRKVYFRIRSRYQFDSGWPAETDAAKFHEESRSLFQSVGWDLQPGGDSTSDTVTKGWQELYLHPMNFSGIIEMDEIPAIQELLKDAKSFCCYGFDCYERYWDITDEEYLAQLETKREEITHEILERCRTKRKNLYITGPVALNVAQKFSVHRLCDKEGKHNLANRFVGELMEQLVQDGLLVTTKTRNGPGVRTATDAEISSPLPGQQQMTL